MTNDPQLTICIPVGPMHKEFAPRAMESVKRQGDLARGLAYFDEDERGTGYARNALLERVSTPYIAFLDADDWLEPEFSGLMLDAISVSGSEYIYSGWYEDETPKQAPKRCYCFDNGCIPHLVTAMLRTEWVKAISGFDVNLPGMEDTDFFLRLQLSGHCGRALNVPLVHYTFSGMRSEAFKKRSDYGTIKNRIRQLYDRGTSMPCCQGDGVVNSGPYGEQQPGDVQAQVIGTPRIYVGLESRRIYPRDAAYGATVWADPRDVARDPSRFRLLPSQILPAAPVPADNGAQKPLTTVAEIAEVMEGFRYDGPYVYLPQNDAPKPPAEKLSVAQLRKMARYD